MEIARHTAASNNKSFFFFSPSYMQQSDDGTPPPQPLALNSAHLDPNLPPRSGQSFFGRIRVVVRCRPLQRDTEGDHTDSRVLTHGDEVMVCEKNNPSAARCYRFDRVLSPDADQATTFAEVAPLVDHVLDGFHATVFAYGQTGSGKTFTMDGLRYVAGGAGRSKGGSSSAAVAMVPDPEGTPVDQHGIMPRMIQLLFDRARARQGANGSEEAEELGEDAGGPSASMDNDGVEYTFRCSYYQIYNEKITDLLRTTGSSPDPNGSDTTAEKPGRRGQPGTASVKRRLDEGGLRVRWQKGDVFKVENLFVCSCASPDEMREMLFTGIQQKVVSSHLMNYQSSRSHCVFTIYVESRARKNGELRSRSELSLVDLAGSEKIRLLSSNPSAKLVKESIDINTSLLALGKVIMALSSNSGAVKSKKVTGVRLRGRLYGTSAAAAPHVPYRDSKLTMLLKHALGGNSLTTMIACISPSDRYVEETTSTLLYASRAKNIRNAPRVNEDATTTLIRQLREEIAQLKAELGYYREMAAKSLDQSEAQVCSRCGATTATTAHASAAVTTVPPSSVCSPHIGEPGAGTAVIARETEQLADSLIAACDMLKNMMQVNSELRDSYDAVRDAQDDAERREASLNAENLALRERLAVLESIVLQDDEDDEEGEGNGANGDDAGESNEGRQVVAKALRVNGRGGNRGMEESTSSPSPPPAPATTPPTPTPPQQQKSLFSAAADATSSPSSTSPATSAVHRNTAEQLPLAVPAAPSKKRKTAAHETSQSASSTCCTNEASQGRSTGQRSRKKSHNSKAKKHRVLARRLKEYEQYYRAPAKTETYEDYYYSQPQKQQQQPSRRSRSAVQRMPPIRASGPAAAQTTAALEDMKATVAKLPKSVVPEYVPASLLRPGLFGSLAFGGQQEEQAAFEQHRSDRAARLRALQRRQQELYQQVRETVRDLSITRQTEEDVLPQQPQMQPQPEQREAWLGQAADMHRVSTAQPRGSAEEGGGRGRRESHGELGSRRSSSGLFSRYDSARTRSPTATYQESRGARKGGDARRSTDGMTRLLKYLDREKF